MATPLLNLTTLLASNSSKEQIISTTLTEIEQALQQKLSVDMTSGNVTLTTAQYTRNVFFDCINVPSARDLIVPNTARIFFVRNSGLNSVTVKRVSGSTVVLTTGQSAILMNDGTNIVTLLNNNTSTSFLSLTDTPSAYTSSGGKNLRVNSSATGVEFGIKHVENQTTDPGSGDDSGDNFSIGSTWQNVTTGIFYICRDNTLGAAIWEPYYSNRIFHAGYGTTGNAPTTLLNNISITAADKVLLYPFRFYGGITLLRLFIRVTTVGASSNVKLALWANDYNTGKPTGVAIAGSNTGISTDSLGIKTVTVSIAPPPGIYWLGSLFEGSTLPTCHSINPANFEPATISSFGSADTDVLRGSQTDGIHGLSYSTAYSTNITTLDLTGASFTIEGGTASIIPHIGIGW